MTDRQSELFDAGGISSERLIAEPVRNAPFGCTVSDLGKLLHAGLRFACIYADPPWRFDNTVSRSAAESHYPTLSLEEIAALPVSALVTENAHLHLWVPSSFLFEAQRVIEAWGFSYKSSFVWVKPDLGCGNYWRVSHEFLLLGVRGSLRFHNSSQPSWLCQERTRHSAKPEKIRRLIERVSPGPYLELFGRAVAENWVVFGNQVERGLFDFDVPEL
jgi:N6-adenosine-specific RNA methylase IME4